VTVCIAGIHEDRKSSSIILVCDRRISLFGGWFSQDGNAKYTLIHKDWVGMFAGGTEETNLMLKEAYRALAKLNPAPPFEKVIDACRAAYAKVRKQLVETQVLPDFDVKSYREFRGLKQSDEALYLNIRDQIREAEKEWNLLFAGFDDEQTPHLFVISGPGKIQYCDSQKYAAIGSGDFAALVWMAYCGYHAQKPLGQLLFAAISAKFFAERASDVGQTTVVTTLSSEFSAFFHVSDDEIANLRSAWESLPKYSDESVKQLEARMAQAYDMVEKYMRTSPKPSVSRRSKQGP
jgi:hypothetical protein